MLVFCARQCPGANVRTPCYSTAAAAAAAAADSADVDDSND